MDAMARMHTSLSEKIAKNQVVEITRTEAIYLQWQLISNWKHGSETWPFSWGVGGLAGMGTASGIMINNAARKALNLKLELKRVSLLPNAILPTVFIGFTHGLLISSKVLIGETKCINCLQAKASAFQLAFGIAFPITLGPLTAMIAARQYYTHDVPYIWEVKKTASLWWKIIKKCQTKIAILSLLHVVLASFLTYQEVWAFNEIETKLDSIEDEINKNV